MKTLLSWKVAGALILAGLSAADTYYVYTMLARQHAWTAMSITMGIGFVAAVIAAVLGASFAAGLLRLRHAPDAATRRSASWRRS